MAAYNDPAGVMADPITMESSEAAARLQSCERPYMVEKRFVSCRANPIQAKCA
jgi:hypothetical protein